MPLPGAIPLLTQHYPLVLETRPGVLEGRFPPFCFLLSFPNPDSRKETWQGL